MTHKAKQFAEDILSLNSTTLIGLGGTRGSNTSGTSGNDVMTKLKIDTMEYLKLLSTNASDEELSAKRDEVEGQLLGLHALGQISSELCDSLIDQLHDLSTPQDVVDKP